LLDGARHDTTIDRDARSRSRRNAERFLATGVSFAGVLRGRAASASVCGQTKPGLPGWPSSADWADLKRAVNGRLAPLTLPDPPVSSLCTAASAAKLKPAEKRQ
jgi:hypothetical protein